MPSVLTGANLANRDLIYLGVSGDGDSASIGLGQFAHVMRRGVNMTYIVENNGVYGLTKGQFSATSDPGSKSKKGVVNHDQSIDLVGLALQLGASFVARGFSGDKAQLGAADQGGPHPQGRGLHRRASAPACSSTTTPGSTKSFDYVREHNAAVNRLDVIVAARRDHARADARNRSNMSPSTTARCWPCASCPTTTTRPTAWSRSATCSATRSAARSSPASSTSIRRRATCTTIWAPSTTPLNQLGDADLVPGPAALEAINAALR